MNVSQTENLATRIRRHVLRMTHTARSSHVGSCLSIADILAVLYDGVMEVRPDKPSWKERDRFILSKGHACAALYAALAETGFFPIDDLSKYYASGSTLLGHASHSVPGVEVSTGSLGHGLSIACGMSLVVKSRVYVVLSDGDCNEGSTWEAAMFAGHHGINNLVAIVDYNELQAMGSSRDVLSLEPLLDKWHSFGWEARIIDGHNHCQLEQTLESKTFRKPKCIIARTIKGKGVSFMENRVEWHYRYPNTEELERALEEVQECLPFQ